MSSDYKQRVVDLLKALETGDSKPFSYINPNKYIQLSRAEQNQATAAE
jgi:hypothetical protein